VALRLLDLSGKRALVTGAGRGLGRALAVGLAEAGADLVICARRSEDLRQTAEMAGAHGVPVTVVPADVTVEADVLALRDAAGPVDILVNNAGKSFWDPWQEVSLDDFRKAFALNLDAPFRLIQLFAPPMMERGWGRIINIASVYGSIAGNRKYYKPDWDVASYFASKHGVHGITHYLAPRLARHGVTINSLSPGGVLTRDQLAELPEDDRHRIVDVFADEMVPMGRIGGEDDYAAPVVFLASPGSQYVTGQNLIVDGGWSVW